MKTKAVLLYTLTCLFLGGFFVYLYSISYVVPDTQYKELIENGLIYIPDNLNYTSYFFLYLGLGIIIFSITCLLIIGFNKFLRVC